MNINSKVCKRCKHNKECNKSKSDCSKFQLRDIIDEEFQSQVNLN